MTKAEITMKMDVWNQKILHLLSMKSIKKMIAYVFARYDQRLIYKDLTN